MCIRDSLTEITNLSLVSGCFPHTLKTAKVLPIFKTGDPEKLENYRPISILPAFFKLYEKVVYNRIYKYLQIMIFFITISLDFVEIILRIWHWFSWLIILFLQWITESRLLEFSRTFRKLLTLLIIIFCPISSITTVLESILLIGSLAIWQTGSSLFSLFQHVLNWNQLYVVWGW